MTYKVRKVKGLFGFGCGVWEKWNCYETGMTWQFKFFFGPYVIRIDPKRNVKKNVDK